MADFRPEELEGKARSYIAGRLELGMYPNSVRIAIRNKASEIQAAEKPLKESKVAKRKVKAKKPAAKKPVAKKRAAKKKGKK